MQQTLLAALLSCGDSQVTVDSLTEELWGTTPPAKVDNALQAQVSRLRRSLARLEPDRTASRLQTCAFGYLLILDQDELDAWRFVRSVDRVRARLENGGSGLNEDIVGLRQALAVWRGPVFGGLVGGPLCQTAIGRYQETRNTALGLLYELELRAGRHAKVLPELTELCGQNPVQEKFCLLLMLALYRSGRQIDALNLYRRFRHRLVEDLGLEPSPTLHRYERAILTHDPMLLDDAPSDGARADLAYAATR